MKAPNPSHIEVIDAKNHVEIKDGQILQVVRETPCFLWVRGFEGGTYQVSKKTKRVIGTIGTFLRVSKQPTMNL